MNMVYTNYLTNCPHCNTNTLCKIVDQVIPAQKENILAPKQSQQGQYTQIPMGGGEGKPENCSRSKVATCYYQLWDCFGQIPERKRRIPPASPHGQLPDPQSHVFAPSPACFLRISDAQCPFFSGRMRELTFQVKTGLKLITD